MGGGDGRDVGGDARDSPSPHRIPGGRGVQSGARGNPGGVESGARVAGSSPRHNRARIERDGRDGREGGRLSGQETLPDARDVHQDLYFGIRPLVARLVSVASRPPPSAAILGRVSKVVGRTRAPSRIAISDDPRAMASVEGVDRLDRGAALLAWLEGEGCSHALRFGETPDAGGVGVFAARDVKRGETLMVMPAACAMRASDTRASPDDDDATAGFKAALDDLRGADGTPIDDSVRVQLLLLRERAAAWSDEFHDGRWAHYVRALPGDELTRALPLSWSDENLRRRLAGTAMHADVLEDRAHLEHLSRALADANARVPSDPTASQSPPFPEDVFGPDRLRWAHAVFWSRAIALPLPLLEPRRGRGRGERRRPHPSPRLV